MKNVREYYKECFEAEKPKFVRVLNAVPSDKADYRPHPRSTSAGDLVWLLAIELRDGCELVDRGTSHQILGHLDGWGHGLHTGQNLPAYPGTRGTTHAAWASYLVRGTGTLDLRIGCCRAGFVTPKITI